MSSLLRSTQSSKTKDTYSIKWWMQASEGGVWLRSHSAAGKLDWWMGWPVAASLQLHTALWSNSVFLHPLLPLNKAHQCQMLSFIATLTPGLRQLSLMSSCSRMQTYQACMLKPIAHHTRNIGCIVILSFAYSQVAFILLRWHTISVWCLTKDDVFPGGIASSTLHLARSVCRRAERTVVSSYNLMDGDDTPAILPYLNRLSDYLFTAARIAVSQPPMQQYEFRAAS